METKDTMKLALVQFESKMADTVANTTHACELVDEAAVQGADLVVLPELFSTGYNLDIIGPQILDLAESIDGPTIRAMQAAAKKNNCYVVAPIALIKDLPGVPYNSAVFINRDGSIQGTFEKVHLWALERFYFRSGNDYPVFETEFGKIGILICYDLGFPEVARILMLKGARVALCPSAWRVQDTDIWDINIPCRALENSFFMAAVNRFGTEDDLYMMGHSKVCNPRGGVIAELKEEKEDILYADLDLSEVELNRTRSPYLRDRRPELYDEVLLWP